MGKNNTNLSLESRPLFKNLLPAEPFFIFYTIFSSLVYPFLCPDIYVMSAPQPQNVEKYLLW